MPLLSGDPLGDAACSTRLQSSPASRGRSTPRDGWPTWLQRVVKLVLRLWCEQIRKPAAPAPKPKKTADLGTYRFAGLRRLLQSDVFGRILPIFHEPSPKRLRFPSRPSDPCSEAFRQTEAELIQLLGGAPLDDPIEDF